MGQRYSLSIRLVCPARISSAEARSGIAGALEGTMAPQSVRTTNYFCSVVMKTVTVTVLEATRPGNPPAKQMKNCSDAHVCKLFGEPPFPARFSSLVPVGCPYHDSLNKG